MEFTCYGELMQEEPLTSFTYIKRRGGLPYIYIPSFNTLSTYPLNLPRRRLYRKPPVRPLTLPLRIAVQIRHAEVDMRINACLNRSF